MATKHHLKTGGGVLSTNELIQLSSVLLGLKHLKSSPILRKILCRPLGTQDQYPVFLPTLYSSGLWRSGQRLACAIGKCSRSPCHSLGPEGGLVGNGRPTIKAPPLAKAKILIKPFECRVPKNSKERYESLAQRSMQRNRGKQQNRKD